MTLNARDKLIAGRVRMQEENPFFSYLAMSLNLIENKKVGSCGIDPKGNLHYNPDFIDKLTNSEVKVLLSHELLHVALLTLTRLNERDKELWNVATDIANNNILVNNGFDFSGEMKNGLVPKNNEIDLKHVKIKDLDKKVAEEIYTIVNQPQIRDKIKQMCGFDQHIYIKIKDGDGNSKGKKGISVDKNGNIEVEVTPEEMQKLEKEWKNRLVEATTHSKMKGNLPAGIERLVDNLLTSKINWKELLYRYITQEIPFDYSYSQPSKRSQVLKVYMPRVKKELIDISIAVDTSGSISKENLEEFMSEIIAIGKSFDSIRINIFFMDTQVNNHYVIENGDIGDLLTKEMKGGGGTDFSTCYDYVRDKIPNTKLLLFFSDAYADFPKHEEYKTVWVITKDGAEDKAIPFGEIIRLD